MEEREEDKEIEREGEKKRKRERGGMKEESLQEGEKI